LQQQQQQREVRQRMQQHGGLDNDDDEADDRLYCVCQTLYDAEVSDPMPELKTSEWLSTSQGLVALK
jgi:hypothetical protein